MSLSLFYFNYFFVPLIVIAVLFWQASLENSGAAATRSVFQPSPKAHCTLLNTGLSGTSGMLQGWTCGSTCLW